jgi:hypothetical protein
MRRTRLKLLDELSREGFIEFEKELVLVAQSGRILPRFGGACVLCCDLPPENCTSVNESSPGHKSPRRTRNQAEPVHGGVDHQPFEFPVLRRYMETGESMRPHDQVFVKVNAEVDKVVSVKDATT